MTLLLDDGTRLHVEIDGPDDAPLTVVFVHGFTLDLTSWRHQRETLTRAGLRCVLYDQRGFGRSERGPRRRASIGQLADDLAAVLATVDGPVVLAGHSMGGMVVASLAGAHPDLFGEKVVGSVLIATTARGSDIGLYGAEALVHRFGFLAMQGLHRIDPIVRVAGRFPFDLAAWLFHDPRSARAHRREFAEMVSRNRFDVMGDYLRAMLEYDELGSIDKIGAAPTSVVAGTSDRITPVAANRLVADTIPDAELVVATRAGHLLPFERADVVDRVLLQMVAKVTA